MECLQWRYGIAATALCNYDNNDCSEFNRDYPECPLEALSEIDGSGNVILGNDVCDSGIYSSNECGWEFKDCAVGQVGQDVQISVRIIFAAMSQDGSTLAVVPFPSLARSIILFRYDIGQRMWIELSRNLEEDSEYSNADEQSIAMNSNGERIAIGSASLDLVRVFDACKSCEQYLIFYSGWRFYNWRGSR